MSRDTYLHPSRALLYLAQMGVPPDHAFTIPDHSLGCYTTTLSWSRLPYGVLIHDGKAYCGISDKFRKGVDLDGFMGLTALILRDLE